MYGLYPEDVVVSVDKAGDALVSVLGVTERAGRRSAKT